MLLKLKMQYKHILGYSPIGARMANTLNIYKL